MPLDKIGRKYIGTRVGFSLAGIGTFVVTIAVLGEYPHLPASEVLTACMAVIGMLSTAIVGDTARPSGMKSAAFGVTANDNGEAGD